MLTRKEPRVFDIPNSDLKSSYAWNPSMGGKTILRISKTSYNTFGFCEQQAYIKYILGVKEPQNDNMVRGTNVHDAVEDFYHNLYQEEDLAELKKQDYDTILSTFKKYIPSESIEKEWEGVITPAKPFTLGEEIHLRKFMEKEALRLIHSDAHDFLPVLNELPFDAIVEIDVFGKPVLVHLTGIVDRAYAELDDEGNWKDLHLHELKTGVWNKDSNFKLESMREEMAFYAILIKKSKDADFGGMDAAYWGWDHTGGVTDKEAKQMGLVLGDSAYRFVEPVQIASIKKVMENIRNMVLTHMSMGQVKQWDAFAVKPVGAESRICEPWCAVKGYCPKYGAVLRGDE